MCVRTVSQVHVGLNEDTGDLIAVKILSLNQPSMTAQAVDNLYREIELMRDLKHPNIVRYLGGELNEAARQIAIFQEWVPSSISSLLENFGPFKERRAALVTRQILQGLVYLHQVSALTSSVAYLMCVMHLSTDSVVVAGSIAETCLCAFCIVVSTEAHHPQRCQGRKHPH